MTSKDSTVKDQMSRLIKSMNKNKTAIIDSSVNGNLGYKIADSYKYDDCLKMKEAVEQLGHYKNFHLNFDMEVYRDRTTGCQTFASWGPNNKNPSISVFKHQ